MCGIVQEVLDTVTIGNDDVVSMISSDDNDNQYADADEVINTIEPNINDVLMGRGCGVQAHAGNQNYRKLITAYKDTYINAPRSLKTKIAGEVINRIKCLSPPGRFLDRYGDSYVVIPQKKAMEKVMQALREKTPACRQMHHCFPLIMDASNYCITPRFEIIQDPAAIYIEPVQMHVEARTNPSVIGFPDETGLFCTEGQRVSHTPAEITTISQNEDAMITADFEDEPRYVTDHEMLEETEFVCELLSDQFDDPARDDTDTSLAIFHLCRRDGLL